VKPRTRRFKERAFSLGKPGGAEATKMRKLAHAHATPPKPPRNESGRFSVTSYRTMRRRPAPVAVRTAIPVLRDAAREQQAGHIGAADQEDEPHGSLQSEERLL
jgi:hypothetical protein